MTFENIQWCQCLLVADETDASMEAPATGAIRPGTQPRSGGNQYLVLDHVVHCSQQFSKIFCLENKLF